MEERLSVRIEADIKNFQQGMSQVENNLKRAEQFFSESSKSVFQLENAIASLSKEYQQGSISNNEYRARIAHLNSALTTQRENLSVSSQEVKRLNAEMQRMNSAGFNKSVGIVQTLQNEVKRLRDAIRESTNIREVARLNVQLEDTQNKLSRINNLGLSSSNNRAGKSFRQLSNDIRGSNTVAMEFNRIIQDAPFGMMGIGNNVQQLAGNFSQLSKNAGGTVPAIKAAFSAMVTGPNLALLAISALTAGITAYNMGAFDFLKSNESKKKSLEDLQKELDEYRATLSTVQQQSIVGAQNAQQELATLDALAAQASNTALSNEQRTAAVEELQKKYPSYLGNLTDEQIKTGDVSEEMSKLRTNLIETAKAYAMIDKVRENSIALLDLEARALTRAQEIQERTNKLQQLGQESRDVRSSGGIALSGQALESIELSRTRINDELNKLLKEQASDAADILRINQENLSLQERTNQALANGGNLVKETASNLSKAAKEFKPIDANQLFSIDFDELQKSIESGYKRISETLSKDGNIVNVPVKLDFTPETLGADAQEQNDAIVEQWKERMEVIKQLGGQLQNTLAGAFEQSLTSGDDFFKSFAEGFKKMLAQMAAQLAASAVIKFLGFIVGGPAGGALSAGGGGSMLGSLFGGAAMRIGQTPAIGSPTGGSSSAGYRVDVNVHGVLRGNDIHVAQQRNNREFGRYY